jgi:putative ABC transport system permease protein
LHSSKGIEGTPELVPSVAARVLSVDGKPATEFITEGPGRRFTRTHTITWRAQQPDYIEVLEGKWWDTDASDRGPPFVAASESAAAALGIKLGSQIEWQVGATTVSATVTAIHRSEGVRPGATVGFILTPGALAGLPTSYYGGVRLSAQKAVELQHAVFERFPTVTVINVADVLDIVQNVVDQIALVVRFVSVFTILGGMIILASGVMATRFRRIREVAILKTLGATRNQITNIFSVEFLVLGTVAGLIGAVLASGFANLTLELILDAEYHFDPIPTMITVVATAVLANIAGWLSSLRVLAKKPLEVLRSE